METYRVWYIGIGGRKDYAIIEADSHYEAREEFERIYWSYHEVIRVEEVGKD